MPTGETKSLTEQIAETRAAARRVLAEQVNAAIASVDDLETRLTREREAARRAIVGDEPAPKPVSGVLPVSGTPQQTIRAANTRKSPVNQSREKKIMEKVLPMNWHGLVYCQSIDNLQVPTPKEWQHEGCPPKYQEAYETPEWRKRIWDEKTRLMRKAKMMPKATKT